MNRVTLVGLMVLGLGVTASATILVDYQANPDPETVGWTAGINHPEYPPTLAAGTEADGTKYWEIADVAGSLFNYSNSGGIGYGSTRGSAEGWTLTAKAKVISAVASQWDPIPYSIALNLRDGWHSWTTYLTTTGVYADYNGGLQLMKALDTTAGYHTYQMIYAPTLPLDETGSVSIYVDGVLAGSYSSSQIPIVYPGYGVTFGSQDTWAAGDARWNQVTMETGQNPVPEPMTLILLGLGGLLIRKK